MPICKLPYLPEVKQFISQILGVRQRTGWTPKRGMWKVPSALHGSKGCCGQVPVTNCQWLSIPAAATFPAQPRAPLRKQLPIMLHCMEISCCHKISPPRAVASSSHVFFPVNWRSLSLSLQWQWCQALTHKELNFRCWICFVESQILWFQRGCLFSLVLHPGWPLLELSLMEKSHLVVTIFFISPGLPPEGEGCKFSCYPWKILK